MSNRAAFLSRPLWHWVFLFALAPVAGTAQAGFLVLETNAVAEGCDFHPDLTPFKLDPQNTHFRFDWSLPYEGWESQIPIGLQSRVEYAEVNALSNTLLRFDVRKLETNTSFYFFRAFCLAAPGANPTTAVFGDAGGRSRFDYGDVLQFTLDPAIFPPGAEPQVATDIRFSLVSEHDVPPESENRFNFGQFGGAISEKFADFGSEDPETGWQVQRAMIQLETNSSMGPSKSVRSISLPLYSGQNTEIQNTYSVGFWTEASASSATTDILQNNPYYSNDRTQLLLAPLPDGVSCTSSSGRFPGCEIQSCQSSLKPRDLGCGIDLQTYLPHLLTDACEFVTEPSDQLSDESPVGAVAELSGSAVVTRSDGTVEVMTPGTPVYIDDIVKTASDGTVNIAFIDETEMNISENGCVGISEYSFHPVTEAGSSDLSFIRGLFVYTSGLVGRDDPDAPVDSDIPTVTLGIRGDAGEYLKDLRRYPPGSELGEFGILMETASPVGVTALLAPPAASTTVSFNVAMLANAGTFRVLFGGVETISLDATATEPGAVQDLSFDIDPAQMGPATTLEFVYDGPAGNEALVWGIDVGGESMDRESLFGRTGAGPVSSVVISTPEELARLRQSLVDARKMVLKPNTWELISIPGLAVDAGTRVEDLFSDDLPSSDYGTSWTMWMFDAAAGAYKAMSPDQTLKPGVGYWVIQFTNSDIVLDIPLDLDVSNRVRSEKCTFGAGCYELPLEKSSSSTNVSWNLMGNPQTIETVLGSTVLRYSETITGERQATGFADAQNAGVLHGSVFIYDSSQRQYKSLSIDDALDKWQGAWFSVDGNSLSNIEWLVQ